MSVGSNNPFPSILITEGTEPAAPAAGKQRLYIDSTTHHLMRVPSSGTEVDIEGGGSSDLDAIITASSGQDIADALSGAAAPDAGNVFATMADVGGGGVAFAILQDQKTQNTAGGTFTSGAWRTRVLNTEVSDSGNIVTIASNQFTPIAGTYRLVARAPAYSCDRHQTRLQNVTAASTTATGCSRYASSGHDVETDSVIDAIFTANGTDAYEIQHQCQTTSATIGFGVASNFTTEVYTSVLLQKTS